MNTLAGQIELALAHSEGKMSEYDRLKAQKEDITAREKSEAAIAIGLTIYARMVRLARDSNQTVGEKRNYYVTLEQLEAAFISIRDELRAQPMSNSRGGGNR